MGKTWFHYLNRGAKIYIFSYLICLTKYYLLLCFHLVSKQVKIVNKVNHILKNEYKKIFITRKRYTNRLV